MPGLAILTAIKTSEWHRYDGLSPDYAMAGTTGSGAVNLRCHTTCDGESHKIEFQRVGDDAWINSGYSAVMRYDSSRGLSNDGEGFTFWPYRVTELADNWLKWPRF